jgi:hypothetical protein
MKKENVTIHAKFQQNEKEKKKHTDCRWNGTERFYMLLYFVLAMYYVPRCAILRETKWWTE